MYVSIIMLCPTTVDIKAQLKDKLSQPSRVNKQSNPFLRFSLSPPTAPSEHGSWLMEGSTVTPSALNSREMVRPTELGPACVRASALCSCWQPVFGHFFEDYLPKTRTTRKKFPCRGSTTFFRLLCGK